MKKIVIVVTVLILLIACSKSANNMSSNSTTSNTATGIDCSGAAKSFSKDVAPIISSTCATGSSCHGSGSVNGPGELLTYTEISNASAQIRPAVLSGLMPKTGSLTSSQKNSIVCWIDNGSLNN